MSTHIERMIAEREAAYDEPLDMMIGATSDDLQKYLPLATGALTEVVSSQLKQKEDAAKAAAFAKSDAGMAQKNAKDARVKAQLAAADALGETDPNGPKHKAAADLDLQARAADGKAAVYAPAGGDNSGGAMVPGGHAGHGGESALSKYKWPIIGVSALLGVGLIVLIARRK